MRFTKVIQIVLILGIGAWSLNGCGKAKQPPSPDDAVVAKINNYELTVFDFKDAAQRTLPMRDYRKDPAKAKADFLEQLVTSKVLIQEAQKENLDKERSFMKEIEHYWEQALIKLLLNKKAAEVPARLTPDNKEKMLEKWVADLRKRAQVKINKDVLDTIDIGG
ncbi:MAG: hypothetical protein PHS37_02605 [Candidatus Omnitrophica bacterium]|nr:hypothetical protein [Candidatus Omnitrophota bacterium]